MGQAADPRSTSRRDDFVRRAGNLTGVGNDGDFSTRRSARRGIAPSDTSDRDYAVHNLHDAYGVGMCVDGDGVIQDDRDGEHDLSRGSHRWKRRHMAGGVSEPARMRRAEGIAEQGERQNPPRDCKCCNSSVGAATAPCHLEIVDVKVLCDDWCIDNVEAKLNLRRGENDLPCDSHHCKGQLRTRAAILQTSMSQAEDITDRVRRLNLTRGCNKSSPNVETVTAPSHIAETVIARSAMKDGGDRRAPADHSPKQDRPPKRPPPHEDV